ncbi:MAG: DUF5132 domain-containing protein, partial [Candidatus Competibacteraceae bacterium]|nr:DUF5132 domain-containing protein [Candidatus Competibacteraceae bacterium]
MALFEDLFKGDTVKGVAIGAAAATVATVLAPALAGVGRPFARAAIKSGIIFYEKSRETVAEMAEMVDDLVAEARAELEQEQADRLKGMAEESRQATGEHSEAADPGQPGGHGGGEQHR